MIEIYVNDLEKAAKQAGKAAAQCTDYAKTLEKKVLHGINNYSGGNTANMSAAQRSINAKRSALTKKAQSFTDYQRKLTNFKDKVVNTENRLYGKITSLYGRFEKEYGIKSEETTWEKIFGFFWGDDGKEWFRSAKNKMQSVREQLRNWYKYKGGKETILAAIGIAMAVIAVIEAFAAIAVGGLLGIVAAVVALITFATSLVQMAYYAGAIADASNGITHMAGRKLMHGENETFVSTLRRAGMYEVARAVGTVEAVGNMILFFSKLGQFFTSLTDAGGLKEVLKGYKSRRTELKGSHLKDFITTVYKYTDMSFLGQIKLLDGGLKAVSGLMQGKWHDVVDGGMKLFGGAMFGPIYEEGKTTHQFKALTTGMSNAKSALKVLDGITGTWNFQTVYNFTYDAKMGKDVSKISIGDFKLENFGSLGKFTVFGVEKIVDVISGIKGLMKGHEPIMMTAMP